MPQIQKKFALVIIILFIQVALSVTGGILVTSLPTDNKIVRGVYINNVSIGGLTEAQAVDKVTRLFQFDKEKIRLKHEKNIWEIKYTDIGAKYNYREAVDKAYGLGRDGNILWRMYTVFKLKRKNIDIPLEINYDQDKLDNQLKQVSAKVNQPAKDASIDMQDDAIVIVPEKIGLEVDVSATLAIIADAINQKQEQVIEMVVKQAKPQVLAIDLKEIKDPLSIAVTSFETDQKNRADNIKLAAQVLNGTVLNPGQIFSFNEKVGSRLQANGYKEAPVFDEGRVVPGVGGGVCQVSTTLYNSVLNAGLDIKERNAHSKPVSYVPLGQDAAVADGKLDLKFINNLNYPIGIIVKIDKGNLIIRVFGKQEKPGQTIKLVSDNIQTYEPKVVVNEDANLNKGYSQILNPGEKGYRIKLYRVWYQNGKQNKKELISDTTYDAISTVIRVGTKSVINTGK